MKKLTFLLVLCCAIATSYAQTTKEGQLKSQDFCIEEMSLIKEKDGKRYLKVLVNNKGKFFSYPSISIKVKGKEVGAIDWTTYGQGPGTVAYRVPTKLTKVPKECVVTINEGIYKTSCDVPYPCKKK